MKDWTGNRKSTFVTLGASNHTDKERESNDFYATDPIAIDKLVKVMQLPHKIWECACGTGCLSDRLKDFGLDVVSTDLVDRGYGGGKQFLGNHRSAKRLFLHPYQSAIQVCPGFHQAQLGTPSR